MYSGHAISDRIRFNFSANLIQNLVVSKQVILSEIAKLFVPLGLLSPIIVIAKLILQDLWQLAIQWDESVPQDIHTPWIAFRTQINLNQLKISRCVKFNVNRGSARILRYQPTRVRRLHIPSHQAWSHHSKLLCSKSRVAPHKTISLPRLELWRAQSTRLESLWNSRNAQLIYDWIQRLHQTR